MADSEEKNTRTKTTVTVSPELLELIKDEQHRLRKSGQLEPSQGELVNRAWGLYLRDLQRVANSEKYAPGQSPVLGRQGKDLQRHLQTTGTLSHIDIDISDNEKGLLQKCLRILRSVSGPMLQNILDGMDAALGGQASGGAPAQDAPAPIAPDEDLRPRLKGAGETTQDLKHVAEGMRKSMQANRPAGRGNRKKVSGDAGKPDG